MAGSTGNLTIGLNLNIGNFTQQMQSVTNTVKLAQAQFDKATSALDKNATSSDKLKLTQQKLNTQVSALSKGVESQKTRITELKKSLEGYSTTIENSKKKVEANKKTVEEATKQFGENSKEVKEAQKALKNAEGDLKKNENAYARLSNEILKNETQLAKNEAQLESLNKDLEETNKKLKASGWSDFSEKASKASKTLDKIGTTCANAGKKLSILTAAIGGVATISVKTAAEFETAMSNVQAISGLAGDDLLVLEDKAREMGKATSFSAKEAADALSYMALAGWDVNQMLAGIEPILRLAEAGAIDLATASDLVTDSMGGLKLTTDDLSRYLDVVARTSQTANASAQEMLEAFINVGATTSNLGIPLEEASAALGILANNGNKGYMAGTKLNSILTRMTAQSSVAQKAWKSIGIEVYDNEGKFRGLTTVLEEVRQNFGKLTQEEQQYFLKQVAGADNITDFLNMMNAADGQLQALTATIDDSEGALNKMAATMKDNLNGRIETMQSALSEVAIIIGKTLIPMLEKVVDKITKFAGWFANLNESTQQFILVVAGVVAALGPLLIFIGAIFSACSSIAGGLSAISGAMAAVGGVSGLLSTIWGGLTAVAGGLAAAIGAISWPVVGIVALIGTLIGAGVALYRNWEEVKEWCSKLGEKISTVFSNIGEKISNTWDKVKSATKEKLSSWKESTGEIFTSIKDKVVLAFDETNNRIGEKVDSIKSTVGKGFTWILQQVGVDTDNLYSTVGETWDKVKSITSSTWDKVKSKIGSTWKDVRKENEAGSEESNKIMEKAYSKAGAILEKTYGKVKKNISEAWSDIKTSTTEAFEAIKKIVSDVWDATGGIIVEKLCIIKNDIAGVFDTIKNTIKDALSGITSIISDTWTFIKDTIFKVAGDGIKALIEGDWEGFKQIISDSMTAIKTKISEVWEAIKEIIKSSIKAIKDAIKETWENIKKNISEASDAIKENLGEAWGNIKEKVSDTWKDIKKTISNAWKDIKCDVKAGVTHAKDAVVEGWNKSKEVSAETWENVKGIVKNSWSNIKQDVKDGAKSAKEAVLSGWSKIKDNTQETFNNVKSIVKTIFFGIAGDIGESLGNILTNIKNWCSNIVTSVSDGLSGVFDMIISPFRKAKEWITNNPITNAVSGAISGIKDFFDGANGQSINVGVDSFSLTDAISSLNEFSTGVATFDAGGSDYYPTSYSKSVAKKEAKIIESSNENKSTAGMEALLTQMLALMTANTNQGTPEFAVYLDSKQIAKSTAKYVGAEINKIEVKNSRLNGIS